MNSRNAEKEPADVFYKKSVLKSLAKFPVKFLCQSLFLNKTASLKTYKFIKKATLTQIFSCEFCKIFKSDILQNTSRRLLLKTSSSEKGELKRASSNVYFPKLPEHLFPIMLLNGCFW